MTRTAAALVVTARLLEEVASLRELDLHGCPVTRRGVERLQAALPDCRIRWDP